MYQSIYGPIGGYVPYQYYQYVEPNRQLPFLETLDLPNLSKLINDPIQHNASWPPIPVKLPLNILKFDGKQGDDPKNHVMTFHIWCSYNSLMDDSIQLRLFQCSLTGMAAKWYIELPRHSFVDFSALETVFLTHFQLPICYKMGTDLLTSPRQDTSTHISDHIHEWRRRRGLIKAPIPNQLLADWFTKYLLPPIT